MFQMAELRTAMLESWLGSLGSAVRIRPVTSSFSSWMSSCQSALGSTKNIGNWMMSISGIIS